MAKEIIVPPLGESVSEATVSRWLKRVGDVVKLDEPLVELETDKVTLEVNAPTAGVLSEIKVENGGIVVIGAIIGVVGDSATAPAPAPQPQAPQPTPVSQPAPQAAPQADFSSFSPAAHKIADENDIAPSSMQGTGKDGRVTKQDVTAHMAAPQPQSQPASQPQAAQAPQPAPQPTTPAAQPARRQDLHYIEPEQRVKMTRLRMRIAERLKEAQNTAALLTSFNEIDMTQVLAARDLYRDKFEKRYGIRLGMMSFFVKAVIAALKEIPVLNAEIDGDEIIYKNHYDIGVAVSTPTGLVVPVVRDADFMNFSEIELAIAEMGNRARQGKITLDDLSGGTFTITNGGVFGSLMSTPIINPPQTGILGMHKIEKRAVVVNDQIVIRPMMYVALTYDHRIIDGREAVTFLVRVKEYIEDLQRLLLGI